MNKAYPYLYNRMTMYPDGSVKIHECVGYFVDKKAFYDSLIRWNRLGLHVQENSYIYSETQKQYNKNESTKLTEVPWNHFVHTGRQP